MALPGRRRRPHPLEPLADPDRRRQLRRSRGRLDLARQQLRSRRRVHDAGHAGVRRRRALHRRRPAAAGGGYRRRHRRDALDLPRAGDDALPPLAALRLRQGRRLRGDRRPGRRLRHLAGLLPLGAGRRDRAAAGGLGRAGRHRQLLADRRRRPHPAAGGRLGSVAGLGRPLRPGPRHSPAARDGHRVVAAHRGQRRGGGARGPRAELRPDPHRERAGRHHGRRRPHRRGALEVPHDPAARRVRPRDLGERRLALVGRHVHLGAGLGRPRARARLPGDQRLDRAVLHGPPPRLQPVRRQRPGARRRRPGSGAGTSRSTAATSGTTTCRSPRS